MATEGQCAARRRRLLSSETRGILVDLTIPGCLSQKLPNKTGVVNETRVSWEVSGLLLGGESKGWALI